MNGPPTSSDSTRNAGRRTLAGTRAEPELLAQVGLFADLTPDELVGLAALMRPRPYAKDEVIYLRGDPGTAFYVIASGKVKIALTSPDGKELILRRFSAGGFHGELALLDDEPRSADAIATENSVLLVLQRDAFRSFLAEHPDVVTEKLPSYAPETNPDEMVWEHTKHGRLANFAPEDTTELRAEVVKELERLHRRPKLLASFIRQARIPIRLRT